MTTATEERTARRGGKAFAFALGFAIFATLLMLGLTAWQLARLEWKTDLIARIEARVSADPVPLPAPSEWAALQPADYEYRRVTVTGTYVPDAQADALALTERGSGFWVMAPLRLETGEIVYINRGYVPQERKGVFAVPSEPVSVTGLMRVSEPDGLLLRPNDAGRGRWYSRDVAAMSAAAGLPAPAPFFIDRAADADAEALPAGGLTRVSFTNHHLLYAIQFLLLALVSAGGAIFLIRHRRRNPTTGNDAEAA
ncbi:SURF1 family protein [Rhizobiaceae bacterium BDR2-2]|uniref:SURF1-like protein n=1 Tax=Ectorhizobium quercum TaxID=2965071 RepID=A0AAE3N3X4_9HYPH|nr:SURF1 family protein [Ectorhizobium quercum]MCX8998042.1 SURF1 family protein [Ectorhizobium quercum]